MARKATASELTSFTASQAGSNGRYPWSEWTTVGDNGTGDVFIVKAGEDYKGKPESFRYVLRAQATKRQLTVKVQNLDDGEMAFQFSAKPEQVTETEPAKSTK